MQENNRPERTSTFSGPNGGNCVVCGRENDGTVTLRETDDLTNVTIRTDVPTFTTFLTELRSGIFTPLRDNTANEGESFGIAIIAELRDGNIRLWSSANPDTVVVTTMTNFDKFVMGVLAGEFDDLATDLLPEGAGAEVSV